MRSLLRKAVIVLYFVGLVYLLLPAPNIPALPASFRSDEPGDTGQIPGIIAAFYTNKSREEVIGFYSQSFARSSLSRIPLITYKLNHPPEYAREIIIDTMQSSFFEELLHPLRESLFVNGYYIQVYNEQSKLLQSFAERGGEQYKNKITLFYVGSNSISRIIIYSVIYLLGYVIIRALLSILRSSWLNT